jgi:hypothetical protein
MAHLNPDQFVDIAEGLVAETDAPHLATCVECRLQLADVRAMISEAAIAETGAAPEPSPLFWNQLSARVRDAVAEEAAVPRSWRERLLHPRVLVPSFAGALAVAVFVLLHPGVLLAPPPMTSPAMSRTSALAGAPLPGVAGRALLPELQLSLPPLGNADDPQLDLVADYGDTLGWDEMRDEMALSAPAASSDAVVGALNADEQRELQRLLADEMAQPAVPENRS